MKKILILSANPINTAKLRLDEEVREIQAGLERAKSRDKFEIITRWAVRTEDFRRALLDHEPQIVHFSGHGEGAGGLALENNSGQMQLVSTESLTRLFKLFQGKIECVLLNALCRERKFVYILTPRQMGKSSLMVHTAQQLTKEGIQSVIIDLTRLGTQVTDEEWYLGLITEIADQLMLDTDIFAWWQSLAHLGVTQRLTRFLQKILLTEIASPIVIFVDEIDTTLSLDFTDNFFAAIRYLYNARVQIPEFHRLSFVLIGVATPGDLIRDPKRTPFNIGHRVDLSDFTFEEALSLAEGLGLSMQEAQQVLKWVLKWTGGHPYLTQHLCRTITEQGKSGWSEAEIDRLVKNTFFSAMSKQENNLQFVRDMLTKRAPDLFRVLTTYSEILRGKLPIPDEEQSLIKSHLKLSGIVRPKKGVLQVSNRIYREVFDNRWIKQHLPIPSKLLTFRIVFILSLFVTGFTVTIRKWEFLQPWELSAYDQMLRYSRREWLPPSRPVAPSDNRLLLVTVTEDDIQREKYPLPDATVNKLLAKLESYRPRVIGINMYRNQQTNFGDGVANKNDIISICKLSSLAIQEIPPPPNVSIETVGFSDLITDNSDRIVRRSLLFADSQDKKCNTSYSFAAMLALNYLEKEGISQSFSDRNWVLGKSVLPPLQKTSGSYENMDAGGYQIMINYSNPDVARQVTLSQVLNNKINPNWVKDKLVIIGNTVTSIDSGLYTPYNVWQGQPKATHLLFVHAQVASQILSTVLDGKPMIWYWSDNVEITWMWLWSLAGGILAWRIRNPALFIVALGISLCGLVGICYLLFLQAGWIPVIPPALVLIISGTCVIYNWSTLR